MTDPEEMIEQETETYEIEMIEKIQETTIDIHLIGETTNREKKIGSN